MHLTGYASADYMHYMDATVTPCDTMLPVGKKASNARQRDAPGVGLDERQVVPAQR